MHSAFENPGSIREPSITFGFPSRPETMMLLRSIIWELIFAIYGGHLPLHTARRTLQSPHLSFPPGDFCMKISPSASLFQAARYKKVERKRKVVVFFVDDESRSYRELRTICFSDGASRTRMFLVRLPKRGSCFSRRIVRHFLSTLYSTYVYTLGSQGNVTTSYEYCAAKF